MGLEIEVVGSGLIWEDVDDERTLNHVDLI